MVTLKDVAREAGVSVSTASRILRGIGYRHEATERRVREAAEKLKYVADSTAQRLRSGQSSVVGVIVSDINNPFYNMTMSYLESMLKSHGYTMLITYSFENPIKERDCFTTLIASKVSHILFTPVTDKNLDMTELAKNYGIHVIQLYRRVYPDIYALTFDDEYGAYLAAQHFYRQGCTRPLLIEVEYAHIKNRRGIFPLRENGFYRAMNEAGSPGGQVVLKRIAGNNTEEIMQMLHELKPDAVLTATNALAMDTLRALKTLSIDIPNDVLLATFDDLDWVGYLDITAVHQPIDEFSNALVSAVLDGADASEVAPIAPVLIARKSTKKMPE